MNKKMKELLGRIATKQKEAQALLDEKDFDSAEKALDECPEMGPPFGKAPGRPPG